MKTVQSLAMMTMLVMTGMPVSWADDLVVRDRDGQAVEFWKRDPIIRDQIQVRDKYGEWTKTIRRDPLSRDRLRVYDRDGRFEKEIRNGQANGGD